VAQWVNVSGPRSPPVVPGPEDVSVVEKDLPDFRILRFENCEMVKNVPNRSGYGKEKANQSDDIDASKGVQETYVNCQGQMSRERSADPTRITNHCSPVLCNT
jgi:hypothetical protein